MKQGRLQNLQLMLYMALSCVSGAAAVIHLSGYKGRDVQVPCPYADGYESYEKYLCRNDCGGGDVLVTTTQGTRDKYSITDDRNKRVYTTTISNLTSGDARKYWCGVTRTGKDYYPAEVQLNVVPDSCCDSSTTIDGQEEGSVSISCVYDSENQNNLKYFCRGQQPSTCLQQAVVTSDRKPQGRYTLTGGSLKFTVTINRLTRQDSGWYLCGVHRNTSLDVFSAVKLEVKEWCCMQSKTLRGTVGQPLMMECLSSPQHPQNNQFLCKGDNRNSCTDIVRSGSSRQTGFTLQSASTSSFTVKITEVTAGDAGTYWCGSDSNWSPGDYSEIVLSVVFPITHPTTSTTSNTSTTTVRSQSTQITEKAVNGTSLPHPVVYIGPAVVLLVLIPTLIVLCKYKCHKDQGPAVIVTQSTIKGADAEQVFDEDNIYSNQEVTCSNPWTSKQQEQYDDTGDQQDCMYENFNTTDDIYCNDFHHQANKR